MSDSSVTLLTVARQVPRSTGFLRKEYWSGLPFPSPRDLPNSGIKPTSPALAGGFFTIDPPGKSLSLYKIKPTSPALAGGFFITEPPGKALSLYTY